MVSSWWTASDLWVVIGAVGCLDFMGGSFSFLEGQGLFDGSLEGQLFRGEMFPLHPHL